MHLRWGRLRIAAWAFALAAIVASCGGSEPLSLDPNQPPATSQYGTEVDDVLLWATAIDGGSVASGSTVGNLAAIPSGGKDAYVRFTDDAGAVTAEDQFGVDGDDAALGNDVAPDGAVYVAGYTNGSLAADHAGSADIWIRRYSAEVEAEWTLQLGGPEWDRAYGVVADGDGAYVTGYTFGDFAQNQVGGADAFVARVNADGTLAWLNQYGSDALDWGQGGAPAPDGGVYLVGFTEGDIAAANAGERDAFVMEIDTSGNVVRSAQFGSTGLDWATSAIADDNGVVVVGHTSGDLAGPHLGEADVFVMALDAELNPRWTLQFGSDAQDQGYGIAAVEGGYIVSGYTMGTVGAQSYGDRDGLVAQISEEGELVTILQVGSDAADETYGVAAVDGGVRLVGYSLGSFAADHLGGTDIIELVYGGTAS